MKLRIEGQQPLGVSGSIYLTLIIVLLSFNPIATKITTTTIQPHFAAFVVNLSFAIIFNLIFFLKKSKIKVPFNHIVCIIPYALIISIQTLLFFFISKRVSVGLFTIIIFSFPIFVAVFAPIIIETEKFHLTKLIGCLIASIGLTVAFSWNSQFSDKDPIILLAVLVPLLEALGICYNKKLIVKVNRFAVLAYSFTFSTPVLAFIFLLNPTCFTEEPSRSSIMALIFQILITGVFCRITIQNLLSKHSATTLSAPFSIVPIIGVFFSFLFLNQLDINTGLIVGTVFVSIGIFLCNYKIST